MSLTNVDILPAGTMWMAFRLNVSLTSSTELPAPKLSQQRQTEKMNYYCALPQFFEYFADAIYTLILKAVFSISCRCSMHIK